jgi:hypothetical protein
VHLSLGGARLPCPAACSEGLGRRLGAHARQADPLAARRRTLYRLQLQYVMASTGFETVDYWCYRPDLEPVIMTVARDDKTIATLILNAGRTWEQVLAARAA